MIERGEITGAVGFVVGLVFVLALAGIFAGCGGECDDTAFGGSCIGIDPPATPEPEFTCPEGFICMEEAELWTFTINVCTRCQESVVCEADTDWTDECDADVPPGHLSKSCPEVRGNR